MLSSHEIEALNPTSPKERMKQLIVISIAGIAFLSYHLYDAGLFNPIDITADVLELSNSAFIYKTVARDYLTSAGNLRAISDDLLLQDYEFTNHQIYTIFLDSSKKVIPTNYKRSITGTVVDTDNDSKTSLLSGNKDDDSSTNVYAEYKNDDEDGNEGRSKRFWKSINYKLGIVPTKSNVLKVQFRFTNGFLSSLVHFYKVVPAIIDSVKGKGILEPIIIYTCNSGEEICTFYSPLENMSQFHLGELDADQYARKLIKDKIIDDDSTSSSEEDKNKDTEL